MRRRPIDVDKRIPLIRSQKELALDDDTKVQDGEQVWPCPALLSEKCRGAASLPDCEGRVDPAAPRSYPWVACLPGPVHALMVWECCY